MQIIPVPEFEGGPTPLWYYTKGHIDKEEFLAELRDQLHYPWSGLRKAIHPDCAPYSACDADNKTTEAISHEWWHFFPTGVKDPSGCYAQVGGPGRGNMAVTVLNRDYRNGLAEDVGLLMHGIWPARAGGRRWKRL